MKNYLILFVILIIVPSCFADNIEVGITGGLLGSSYEDQGAGSVFGFKAKYILSNNLAIYGGIGSGKFGRADFYFGTREGSKITYNYFGLQIGFGFYRQKYIRTYAILGIANFQIRRQFDKNWDVKTLDFGLGVEYAFCIKFALECEGKIIGPGAGGFIRILTLGLNYVI